jgi:cobalt-zinc-cadmium efflux system outer membrane protein
MRRIAPPILVLLAIATSPATALPAETAPDTLESLLREAFEKNPTILAARARLEGSRARSGHVGTLPNPQVRATLFLLPIETRVGPQRFALSVNQNVPFPSKLGGRVAVAEREADVAQALVEGRIRDVLTQVRLAWYELHYLVRALEIVRGNQEIARRIVELGANAFGKGRIPHYDVNRAEAEMARLAYDELALRDLADAQWRTLNALLDRKDIPLPEIALLPSFELATPLADLETLAREHRPELAAARSRKAAAEAMVALVRKDYWPDFGIGLTWLVHEAEGVAPDRGQDAFGITVGLDLPVWYGSLGAKVDEARAGERAAAHETRVEDAALRTELADRVYDFVNARRLLRLYDANLLPQAAAALHSADAEAGRAATLGELLERRAIHLQFSLARERALADTWKALARLEQAVGTPLALTLAESPSTAEETAAGTTPPSPESRTEEPEARPEGPGHVRHDDAWKRARALARKHGLAGALGRSLPEALLVRAVLRRNRSIAQADEALAATLERLPQVAWLDNAVAQYVDLSAGLTPGQGGMAPGPMDRESATGPGSLALKSAVAANEIEQARVRTGLARRQAVTEARIALADYRYAADATQVIRELLALTTQLREAAQQRVAAGEARLTDVLQAEMLEEELQNDLENLRDQAARARARMATLADLPADFAFGPPGDGADAPALQDLPTLQRHARKRQELRILELEVDRLEKVIALTQNRTFPALSTGQSDLARPLAPGGRMAFPEGPMVKEDIVSAGRQSWLDELLRRRDALQEERQEMGRTIENQVAQAHAELRIALRTHELHRGRLLDKARQTLDLTLAAYRQGGATFAELLAAQRETIHHQLTALDALRNARKAHARLQDSALTP